MHLQNCVYCFRLTGSVDFIVSDTPRISRQYWSFTDLQNQTQPLWPRDSALLKFSNAAILGDMNIHVYTSSWHTRHYRLGCLHIQSTGVWPMHTRPHLSNLAFASFLLKPKEPDLLQQH